MIISSESYRRLVSRTPATIQAARAQYVTAAATPGGESKAPAHLFADEAARAFDAATATGTIELDLSSQLATRFPATTINLLARYLVLREGEEYEFSVAASSVLYYVLKGSGRCFLEDEVIEWKEGDAFLFPGGGALLHEAPDGDAVLFVVTDEPFLASTGCAAPDPEASQIQSAHFPATNVAAQLEDAVARSEQPLTQMILQLSTTRFERSGCVVPMMSAGIAILEAGAQQQPHCHDADTISLCIAGDGVYSTIDGNRTDWVRNAALLTPAGAVHAQHNGGDGRMFSFFVQDRGPRGIRTWDAPEG